MDNIIIVTRNFPPLVGGMERLMDHAARKLRENYNCTIIGPAGCENHVDNRDNVFGYPVSPLSSFLLFSTLRALSCTRKGSFRFCISGSGLTAPIAGLAKSLYNIPAISFVHGLDLIANNTLYQKLFIPWLRKMDLIIANSQYTADLAQEKGVKKNRIRIINPGVEIPPKIDEKNYEFLKQHNLNGKKILLFVGRLLPRKGLAEFLQNSFTEIVRNRSDTVLVVIGVEPKKAIASASGYYARIQKIIIESCLSEKIRMLGDVPDEILHYAYQAADLLVFPLQETPGDVEGFGMVATEAAAHGLPTVAFAVGGVTDAVGHEISGYLVKEGDYRNYTNVILKYLENGSQKINRKSCIEFARSLSWDHFGESLLNTCSSLYHQKQ